MTKAEEIKKLKAEVKDLKRDKQRLLNQYEKQKQELLKEVQTIMNR